jgi:2'-hydroxyisoflavone reductase
MAPPSRRRLLRASLAAASLLALGPAAALAAGRGGQARGRKRLLLLGGTGFLGPAIVAAARARGHHVTLFNRGKTRPELFPDVEKLRGDRDPAVGEGLKALEAGRWDAVVDTSGYFPRHVRASARLLAPRVGQYLFVSTASVYARHETPGMDERAPLARLADPTVETFGEKLEHYTGLKALCEAEVQRALPRGAVVVRPGFIVGPGDETDRLPSYLLRHARGGETLWPGRPADPLQVLDVRDLADWLVLLVERGTTGTFNATGPAEPWTMGGLLAACQEATGVQGQATWVPAEFLARQGDPMGAAFPIWKPAEGPTRGYHRMSNARALKAGLRLRPARESVRDVHAWLGTLPAERRAQPRAGLAPEREAALLKLWAEARAAAPAGKAG